MSDLQNLAHHVRERRQELGLSQMDVWKKRGGPSSTKMGQIEDGQPPEPSATTKGKLERSLRWEPGSVDAVLAGGAPTLSLEEPADDAWARPADPRQAPREEQIFGLWDAAYTELLRLEAEYARLRGIARTEAYDELHEVWRMWHDGLDGRPWTPPWMDQDETFVELYGIGARPWLRSWWDEQEMSETPFVTARMKQAAEGGEPPTAGRVLRGGDRWRLTPDRLSAEPDEVGDLVAAHEEEGSISGEQEQPTEP